MKEIHIEVGINLAWLIGVLAFFAFLITLALTGK